MTSFGCNFGRNEVTMPGFNLSFKIQGQVYHQIQIYFIDNQELQVAK